MYRYLNQGGVELGTQDDGADYEGLKRNLKDMDFDPAEVTLMMEIVAGIIHLGMVSRQ